MSLHEHHQNLGAILAPDGIPLHYGNQKMEYHSALNNAVLMDRSHEGRLEATGRDRINLIQRISTNDLDNMSPNEGRPTIFTNANGRILDRIMIYNRGNTAFVITEAGRGQPLQQFLQRQVFFNDDVKFTDVTSSTQQFVIHGPSADSVIECIVSGATNIPAIRGLESNIKGIPVYLARRKPISGSHWAIITPSDGSEQVWDALVEIGTTFSCIPAGSLTYNALRIRAGRPSVGRELSPDYIPLEAGLWDEVSFTKGCYTGQEIIARMESRNRLAKTMVTLQLSKWVETPANLHYEGKHIGVLTSSVITPEDEILGIGFVKVPLALPEQTLVVGEDSAHAVVIELAGTQATQLNET